jgi:hypothetical protein
MNQLSLCRSVELCGYGVDAALFSGASVLPDVRRKWSLLQKWLPGKVVLPILFAAHEQILCVAKRVPGMLDKPGPIWNHRRNW